MGSISGISSSYLQNIISATLKNAGVTSTTSSSAASSSQADSNQLSPLAQLLSTLQQLQQSDPTKYKQVTGQIATNLQSAAQSAQSQGNTAAANQLNALATDFSNASKSGQLPNIQDLAQALGGGHHHHHHGHAASSDSDASSTTDSTTGSSTTTSLSSALSQLLSATQSSASSLDPMQIISNTLTSAGITS